MKNHTKFLSVFLAIVMLCLSCPLALLPGTGLITPVASAAEADISLPADYFGENITWRIKNTTLYLEGTGPMRNFDGSNIYGSRLKYEKLGVALGYIEIGEGITSIGDYMFAGLKLSEVTLPDSLTSIGEGAFKSTYIASFSSDYDGLMGKCHFIPENVTYIGAEAFAYTEGIRNLIFLGNITELGEKVFQSSSDLRSVEIPDSVTTIASDAFSACKRLNHIMYAGTTAQWENVQVNDYAGTTENVHIVCKDANSIRYIEKMPSTCSTIGFEEGYYCDECESYVLGGNSTGKLVHPYNTPDGFCVNCGERVGYYVGLNEELTVVVTEIFSRYIMYFTPEWSGVYRLREIAAGHYEVTADAYTLDGVRLPDQYEWDSTLITGDSSLDVYLEAGVTYYFKIDTNWSDNRTFTFRISCAHDFELDDNTDICLGRYSYTCKYCGEGKIEEKDPYHIDADFNDVCDDCGLVFNGYWLSKEESTTRYWLNSSRIAETEYEGYTFFYNTDTKVFDVYHDRQLCFTYDISGGRSYSGDITPVSDKFKDSPYNALYLFFACVASPDHVTNGKPLKAEVSTEEYWVVNEYFEDMFSFDYETGILYYNYSCYADAVGGYNMMTGEYVVYDWYFEFRENLARHGLRGEPETYEETAEAMFEAYANFVNPPVPEGEGREIPFGKPGSVTSCDDMYLAFRYKSDDEYEDDPDDDTTTVTLYNTPYGNYILVTERDNKVESHYGFYVNSLRYEEAIRTLFELEVCQAVAHTNEDGDEFCDVCGDYVVFTNLVFNMSDEHAWCIENGISHTLIDSKCDLICDIHADVYHNDYIEPSCTENGYIGGTVCLECEKVFTMPEVVPAKGHSVVTVPAIPATCTESGITAYSYCSDCGTCFNEPQQILPSGHADKDTDGICDNCGILMSEDDGEVTLSFFERIRNNLISIIDKIIALFRNLFK